MSEWMWFAGVQISEKENGYKFGDTGYLKSLPALRVFGITSSIVGVGIRNHFQCCGYSECKVRGRIPAGRSAVHPTATGWDELLLDRTAGVRLTIGSFSRETLTVCRR